jgi:hypothetical protein
VLRYPCSGGWELSHPTTIRSACRVSWPYRTILLGIGYGPERARGEAAQDAKKATPTGGVA